MSGHRFHDSGTVLCSSVNLADDPWLTYGYDWGVLNAELVICAFVLSGWYFGCLAFLPFLLMTFAYEPITHSMPWMKNIIVVVMYSLNFVVIPWYIQPTRPIPTTFLTAYALRILAFEMYDDLQDWDDDLRRGRTTFVQLLGHTTSRIVISLFLLVSGLYDAPHWRAQSMLDRTILLICDRAHLPRVHHHCAWLAAHLNIRSGQHPLASNTTQGTLRPIRQNPSARSDRPDPRHSVSLCFPHHPLSARTGGRFWVWSH